MFLLKPKALLLATTDNQAARSLLGIAGTMALGGNAPRGDRMTTGGLVLAFATTMRMVDRVHDRTANARADALPAITTSFTDLDVAVLLSLIHI